MRQLSRPFFAFSVVSALGIAAACGSSPGSSGLAADAGVGMPESGGSDDSGSMQGQDGASDATAKDGGDSGILGANCPAVDAGTFAEAPHGPLPTMAYYGGAVMAKPLVVTFTFKDTPNVAALESFGATITSTPWFTDVTRDYCVPDGGPCIAGGTPGLAVKIAANADATYVDTFGMSTDAGLGGTNLNQFMNDQIAAAVATGTIPKPDANSLFAFYFPPTTTIQGYGTSCQSFGAYHGAQMFTDGTTPIVYAIMPDCPTGDPATDLQGVTISASHEIAEAVTDPGSGASGVLGWYLDTSSYPDGGTTQAEYRNDPWTGQQFGEIGDNCESIPLSNWILDGGTTVQRIWSTSAATAGRNPCVPVPAGEAYYNASTDKVLYVANVGDTFTVDVSAFSDKARSSWRLDAIDGTPTQLTDADGGAPLPYLKLEFVGGVTGSDGVPSLLCVNNGSTGQLKVTLLADPAADMSLQQQQQWPEADGVLYSADVAAATTVPLPEGGTYVQFPYQFWPFAVITPATASMIGVSSSGITDAVRLRALRAHHSQKPRSAGTVRY